MAVGDCLVILGGGQLARMTAYAAYRLGLDVGIWVRPGEDGPAAPLATHLWQGAWEDPNLLEKVASTATAITLENEFVDARVLATLEALGAKVLPSSVTLGMIQDKHTQKTALQHAGLPVPRFEKADNAGEVVAVAQRLGWPLVLKARCNGYDGYGNALLREPADVAGAWDKLAAKSALMVEEFVPFTAELAVMVARNAAGDEVVYPVTQTTQHAHMCHTVVAPAPVSARTSAHAQAVAKKVVRAFHGVGVFGVELFLLNDEEVLINEVAPRPHNSGHYTLEACVTSQFENHVRAVMGWPLGDPSMTTPAAVMVNILGSRTGPTVVEGLPLALAQRGVAVHLYGKSQSRPGRKMGHATALADTLAAAREAALRAARAVVL